MRKVLSLFSLGVVMTGVFVAPALAAESMSMAGFSDVGSSHVNYSAIMDLKTKGVIAGYPDGSFKPEQVVNRVEALKIILNSAKVDTLTQAKAGFKDTASNQWYAPFLNKAVELKIVAGYPDGTFKPTQTVNLAENLKILLNAHGVNTTNIVVGSDPFADVSKSDWYGQFAQYAKDKKLVEADSANKVLPAQGMTRAKLAEVVFRLMYVKEHGLDYFGQVKEDTPPITAPDQGRDDTLVVDIKDTGFKMAEMTIPLGAKVRWTNSDSVKHDVTSTGNFQSPSLATGATWEYTFNEIGTFEYFCSIHPSMKGKLIVKPANQVPTI
jgi:plastocyanin/predicted DNA-binding antitoxin AbrB/MazE fold protein